ncbi:hypothetical protein M8C21_016627 [Ambrosia artemisiifolia]|uniref:C2H2-type domain-containing protein n=1 Tax=Ambrosia artemisiifolia TaxID=4212 RepID=A0AAD5CRH7_AMBAR|nr:hypothetical protein M8C21_016627 [Ambrosia artemisiifolia]
MSAIIPNITSYPTPNPNPIQSHTDASQFPYSHSIDGSVADPTQYQHVDVTTSETTNAALVTARQPESILPFHCEVCNISCNTNDVLEAHKQGKKHVKSVKKLAESSANGQNMAPPPVASETLVGELTDTSASEPMVLVPPPIASETIVGELENKTHRLLQNGATAETLVYCDICNVVCNNQEVFKAHVAGKKHSAKSIVQQASTNGVFDAASDSSGSLQKKPDTFPCEICNITCTGSELLKNHIAGKKHLKKVKELGQLPILPLTPSASPVNMEGVEPSNLPSTPIASQDTPPTKPVVNPEINEGKTVNLHGVKSVCELCGVICDTDEMLKLHMSGKKHRKNVEKSEKLIGPNPAVTTEPAETPKVIGPLQEDGKMVTSDGPKTKRKKSGSDDDAFTVHLAGQKHVAMAVKQAETQAGATGQES